METDGLTARKNAANPMGRNEYEHNRSHGQVNTVPQKAHNSQRIKSGSSIQMFQTRE
jgi:hypothetical protein